MRFLLGLDDTDNLESRGTGHRARMLGLTLAEAGLAQLIGITRHQLLVSPLIPYTSHNSSACLELEAPAANRKTIWQAARDFTQTDSAPGSDAGLCLADAAQAAGLKTWGQRAKLEVLQKTDALALAAEAGPWLAELTGDGGGIIGAAAGVGLRAGGSDGRYLWLPGLRELTGRLPVREIMAQTGIGRICTPAGLDLPADALLDVGEWLRPVLLDAIPVLLVEEDHDGNWHTLAKEDVKQRSQ
ncbi:MAG TPA: hypothetical protein PKO03_05405 [Anaerolineaceae bacterium]|nr:hypothetical protein [Anaerolineaceae bacterium]